MPPNEPPISSPEYPRSRTVTIYTYDENSVFTGAQTKRIKRGVGFPANSTIVVPPSLNESEAAVFDDDSETWSIVPDYRGRTLYDTRPDENGQMKIEQVGPLPEGYTLQPKPSPSHQWDGSSWLADLDVAKASAANGIRAHAKNTFHRIVGTLSALEVDRVRKVVADFESDRTITPEIQIHIDTGGLSPRQAVDVLIGELASIDTVTQQVYLTKTAALYAIQSSDTLDDLEAARASGVSTLQALIS